MKKHIIAAAVALSTLSSLAFAEGQPYPQETTFVSSKTRAEVIHELQVARANGELLVNDYNYPVTSHVASDKTRAQVVQELKTARADGELARMNDLYRGN